MPAGYAKRYAHAFSVDAVRKLTASYSRVDIRLLGNGEGVARLTGLSSIAPDGKSKIKCQDQKPEREPNPALKGTRGYALACFPLVLSARAP